MKNKKPITAKWFFPLTIIMAIVTFVFFAPLTSITTKGGEEIQCSILEVLKLQGLYGTAEAIIYFVVGWIGAIMLDKWVCQKIFAWFLNRRRANKIKEAKRAETEPEEYIEEYEDDEVEEYA